MTKSRTFSIALVQLARRQRRREARWRELCKAQQAGGVREAERAAESRALVDSFIAAHETFHRIWMRSLERQLRVRSR